VSARLTRILCGCSAAGPSAKGCRVCSGAGYRLVRCLLCADSGRIADAKCWRCGEPDPRRRALAEARP
jgi:hypothetical protein